MGARLESSSTTLEKASNCLAAPRLSRSPSTLDLSDEPSCSSANPSALAPTRSHTWHSLTTPSGSLTTVRRTNACDLFDRTRAAAPAHGPGATDDRPSPGPSRDPSDAAVARIRGSVQLADARRLCARTASASSAVDTSTAHARNDSNDEVPRFDSPPPPLGISPYLSPSPLALDASARPRASPVGSRRSTTRPSGDISQHDTPNLCRTSSAIDSGAPACILASSASLHAASSLAARVNTRRKSLVMTPGLSKPPVGDGWTPMPPPPKVTCDLPVPDCPCVTTSASKPRMSQSHTSRASSSGASPESDAAVILYRRGSCEVSSLGSLTATPSPPGSNATAGTGSPSPLLPSVCRLAPPTVAERTGAGHTLQ